MRKLLLAALLVCAFASTAAEARVRAHTAALQVGPCVLHAYTPSRQSGGVAAHGRVDTCGGFTSEAHITLQVCLQVQGPGGYGAYNVNGTCSTLGPYNALSIDSWSNVNYGAVPGRVYRTWDQATCNGTTKWFTSSWWTY